MPSVRETIVQALADALNAPADKPCTTYRTRIDAFSKNELPAFVLFALRDQITTESASVMLHRCTVRLEAIVEGEPPSDSLIDPLYVWAIKALDAATSLDGIGIRRLQESTIQWETEASYGNATAAVIDFEVVFVTKTGDPTMRVDG